MECVLCKLVFSSKVKLVQHFRETHSVAKHRPRRSRVAEDIKRSAEKEFEGLENGEDELGQINANQILLCSDCGEQYTTQLGHTCNGQNQMQEVKHSVSCIYCGQKCKNTRGATIHQVFCEQRIQGSGVKLIHYECPAEDCGAIFKGQHKLIKHVQNHHSAEGITILNSPVTIDKSNRNELSPNSFPTVEPLLQQPKTSPMVTVTMKPHVGKTDGLQDLSLLITPTKGMEDDLEMSHLSGGLNSALLEKELISESESITVEECFSIDEVLKGSGQAVLCVAEDGSVSQTPRNTVTENDTDRTYLLITENNIVNKKCLRSFECKDCSELFLNKESLLEHVQKTHKSEILLPNVKLKKVSDCNYNRGTKRKDDDEDWELVSFEKTKEDSDFALAKGKYEYVCKLCNRNFLSELSYQSHVRNEECKTKKFKLPRMFECHFSYCDSSFFKLAELQKHWQIAHKFTLATENHEFENEKAFSNWLSNEETKHKVRFTCDVRRRKPHRSERLLVCHRFHSLRTSSARKAANKEYSDKHNWVHKIPPCLCFARMKVYQDFDKNTCDYTGKIRVVYYYEHSHPKDNSSEAEGILDHILQRNKRNRSTSFQELKGNDKLQHRQKLENFARIAGKEYRSSSSSSSSRNIKKEMDDNSDSNSNPLPEVPDGHNFLENEGFFNSPVEMVLDGQFDMTQEVLEGPVVTHLDTLAIFETNKLKQSPYKESNESNSLPAYSDDEALGTEDSIVLPASAEDWQKLFQFARTRVETNDDNALKAEASLVLPYEKVIDLISPSDQIPIFQQLWELAYPAINSEEVIQVVKINVVR